jgi:hypothetical protein
MSRRGKGRQRLLSLNSARELIPSHVIGFLRAYQQAVVLHQELAISKAKLSNQANQVLLSQIQVFAVRALETFLRDCFVTLSRLDSDFLDASMKLSRRGLRAGEDEVVEKLAGELSFQNLDAVSEYFRPALNDDLFSDLDKSDWSVYVVGGPQGKPWSFKLPEHAPKWRADLQILFDNRHEIIHNANRSLEIDQSEVMRLVTMAFLIGQLVGILLGQRTSTGIISTEAPLKYVVLLGVVMHAKSKEEVLQAIERANSMPDLDGKFGHVGPAIVPIGLLGSLDFVDKGRRAGPLPSEIHHVVTKQENGRYLIETLFPVADAAS